MSETYTTLADLIEREITPALFDGTESVEPNFDVDGFVQALQDRELIVFHGGQGFVLVTDDSGETPGFWDLVADFDQAAMQRHITITEDPRETMMMVGSGPLFTAEAIELAAEFETDEEFDRLEAIREAQSAGEADYFERWAEKARAAALALGYRAEAVRAISGSPEAHRATKTPYGTLGRTVEEIVWQDAHDSTDLPEGWEK